MRVKAFLAAALALFAVPAAAQKAPLTATFDSFTYGGEDPWSQTIDYVGDVYINPILQGFYPDPSVTRVGNDYYLVTSTFSYFPGIPVFRSTDLVHWTQIGNAIDRPDQLDFKKLGMSRGVFAPSIQFRDGLFYILNTCVDCGGNFVITAKDPAGPWSDPVWLPALEGGIDPSLFFDDDGRTWILNNGAPEGKPEYQGHRAIWIQEFDLKTLKSFGPRKVLVNGGVDFSTKPIWIEGPHILKKDGWYYLICAEGGTAEGHSQVALRSKSVWGPYEPNPNNPILTQRGLGPRLNPITSAGHAQLVQTQNGDWWATFLAVRPYTGDFYNTGRETFLMPVTWKDGWPVITQPGERLGNLHGPTPKLPQSRPAVPMSGLFLGQDEFDGPKLAPHWMMMRNPREQWYRFDKGALVLTARHVGLSDYANPSFLGRRQQHLDGRVELAVRFDPRAEGDRAGLVAIQNDDYWIFAGVTIRDGKRMLVLDRRAGKDDPAPGVQVAAVPLPGAPGEPLYLGIEFAGPEYRFFYATRAGDGSPYHGAFKLEPNRWTPLGTIDATFLSTKTAGGFIGVTFGPYAYAAQ